MREALRHELQAFQDIREALRYVREGLQYGEEGNPLTQIQVSASIVKHEKDVETYNGLLDQVDALGNTIDADEKALGDMGARVLSGTSAKFGRDSSELEQMGGKRSSERKSRTAKQAPAAKTP